MTNKTDPAVTGKELTMEAVGIRGEVIPPTAPAPKGTEAGRTEDLKALHAELTSTYREYLEMAKVKPSILSPSMLGLIQQFLRHNEITAEPPKQSQMNALEKRLAGKRKARDRAVADQKVMNLNKTDLT